MRTTMTIDEDVARQIRQHMKERGTGFKATVNDLLRRGLRSTEDPEPYETPTFESGTQPGIDLDKALALVGAMEDEAAVRRLELRK